MAISTSHIDDPAPAFHRSLENLMARADESNAPTGLLVTLEGAPFGKGVLRDGLAFADTVDQRQWEEMYGILASSRLRHASLGAFKPVHSLSAASPDSSVPIALLHMKYQQSTRRLLARILSARRNDTAIDVPDGPFLEERTAFAASALLPPSYWGFERQPDVHAGLDVQFHLDPACMISNAAAPDRIEIDFDDGNGFRELAVGGKQTVHYDHSGERRLVLRARTGTEVRTAAFLFRVERVTAPNPDEDFEVTATIPHNGVKSTCRILVYRGERNTRITRPFIVAEGFPGGTKPADLYDRINGKVGNIWNPDAKLAEALRQEGYDLVLMFFAKEGEMVKVQIQGLAYAYLAALQEIWKRMGSQGEIIAAGGSMGGLVARYALAYAQTHSQPTGNVTTLMTFDSPHVGANVPYAIQCVTRFYHDKGGSETNAQLDLPAAKQMLMAQRWTWDQNEPFEKKDFKDFYDELGKLGEGGYPSKVKRYAVCNGAADGASGIQPLNPGVIWRLGIWDLPLAKAEAWAAPNGTTGTVSWCVAAIVRWPGRYYTIEGYYGRDGVAGGTAAFFGEMATKFRAQKGAVREDASLASFVPAHSALGYAVKDAYAFKPRDLKPGDVPFTAWYISPTNDAHATINKSIKQWVLKELAGPKLERPFYLSSETRPLTAQFRRQPYTFEALGGPVQQLPVSLVWGATEEAAQTCVIKVTHSDGDWYVSGQPTGSQFSHGTVLLLVRSPQEAIRLIPVFNDKDQTVHFMLPGQSAEVALTVDTRGYSVNFQPLIPRNALPIIQHFSFRPAAAQIGETTTA